MRLLKRTVRRVERVQAVYTVPQRWLYAQGVVSSDRLRLPDFLGIGVAKAGTTWLAHNLRAHPALYLPPGKEVHYFCHRRHRSIRYYAGLFADAGGRVAGEITPNYAQLPPQRVRQIAALMPDVRLLLLLRDPVARAWSHAVMRLARQQGRTIDDVRDADLHAHFESEHSRAHGAYAAILDRWLGVFPAEQLHVALYEDITARPRELLTEVFGFLGVPADVEWAAFPYATVIDRGVDGRGDVVGAAGSPPLPERHRRVLDELYADDIAAARALLGTRVDRWQPA